MTASMFVAICLPDGVREAVGAALGDLPDRVDAAWTRPDGWHLTLAWLDRLDDDLAARVGEVVAPMVAVAPTAEDRAGVALDEPVRLGRAVGLRAEVPRWLEEWQADLVAGLLDGVEPALSDRARSSLQREFRPHVTVARARRGGSPEQLRAALAAHWTGPVRWSPSEVTLLASRTGTGPARYVARARWPLPGD